MCMQLLGLTKDAKMPVINHGPSPRRTSAQGSALSRDVTLLILVPTSLLT